MIATLAVNLCVVRYEARRRTSAQQRAAAGRLDAHQERRVRDVGVLVSLTAVWLGFPLLDPIGGAVIAVLIAYTGYQIARETSRILSDRVVIDEGDVREVVMSVPGVLGCHQIRSRGSVGSRLHRSPRLAARRHAADEAHELSTSSRIA